MDLRYSVAISLILIALPGSAETLQPLDGFLRDGRLHDGLTAYAAPANNAERFSLAILQALDGLQQFVVGFNKLREKWGRIWTYGQMSLKEEAGRRTNERQGP